MQTFKVLFKYLLYIGEGAWHLKFHFAKNVFWEVCFCVITPRHPKLFWPWHSQNFVGGLYAVRKNSYNLASSGYEYSDFPLTHISSQLQLSVFDTCVSRHPLLMKTVYENGIYCFPFREVKKLLHMSIALSIFYIPLKP